MYQGDAIAQIDPTHFEYWGRLSVQYAFSPKWSGELEGQLRRQDYAHLPNIFYAHLAYSGRVWLYYQPDKAKRWRVAFNPVAYFFQQGLATSEASFAKTTEEYRQFGYVSYKLPVGKALSFQTRLGIEAIHRKSSSGSKENLARLRVQEQFGCALSAKLKWQTGVELIGWFWRSSGDKVFYNQFRLQNGLSWTITPNLSLDTGYLYLNQHLSGYSGGVHNHIWYTNMKLSFSHSDKK